MAKRRKSGWYAGLRRSAKQTALLLGPFKRREDAEAVLRNAHDRAIAHDPWCHFDTPCVFKLLSHNLPQGVFSK